MLLEGFASVFNITTMALVLGGVILGIIFGAIPGMSATMAVALCLPITYGLDPVNGISLLLGLYVGGISGGLISAILLNIPGTPSSIATTFDGAPMALNGKAGEAMGIGITYSFIGGMISVAALIFMAPAIARFSLRFGPYEYFAVTLFALTMISSLSGTNIVKGLLSGVIGISLSMFGAAPIDNFKRFTFGNTEMDLGFNLLAVMIGFYAIAEIIESSGDKTKIRSSDTIAFKMRGLGFTLKQFGEQFVNMIRSALIGIGIGILPGIGGGTSNLIAYTVAKKQSKHPEKFGTGIMDGIVASETSNNASVGGALIPLLTLGIPGDTVTAMLLGGLMIQGVQPGPMLFQNNGALIYAIFAAAIVAHIMMVIVELCGLRGFVKILTVPKNILLPIIVCLCMVGAFACNNRFFDVISMVLFGIIGFLLLKMGFNLPPMILGFILAPTIETNLRRGLQLSNGDLSPFVTRPISAVFLAIALLSIIISVYSTVKKGRAKQKSE